MKSSAQKKIRIRAVGIGGAGVFVLNAICEDGLETVAVDTDASSLEKSRAGKKISIGDGNGTGGDTDAAKTAAAASENELLEIASDADIIFVIAGLGGGTGSVIAPLISKLVADAGKAMLFGFAFLPLSVEGKPRVSLAAKALNYLKKHSTATFALPNDIVLAGSEKSLECALADAGAYASKAISSTAKMLARNGIVNIDAASVRKVFAPADAEAFIAYGKGTGANAVEQAVDELVKARTLPVREGGFKAESAFINLRCPADFGMNKMQLLLESVSKKFSVTGRMAFGACADGTLSDEIEVCVTGVTQNIQSYAPPEIPRTVDSPSKMGSAAASAWENVPDIDSAALNSAAISGGKNAAGETAQIPQNPEAKDAPVRAEGQAPKRKFFSLIRKRHNTSPKENIDAGNPAQSEFKFVEMSEQRGFFSDTPPNIRNGEDLDVPTFMRRGIKIIL